jgi:hypothetical protein
MLTRLRQLKKVKVPLTDPKAQRREGGGGGQHYATAALPPGRSGRLRKISPHRDSIPSPLQLTPQTIPPGRGRGWRNPKSCNIHRTIQYSAILHNRHELKCPVVCCYFEIVDKYAAVNIILYQISGNTSTTTCYKRKYNLSICR